MQLFDVFDHTYIISLPSRRDRRQESIAELERVGNPYDGQRISFLDAVRPSDRAGFTSIGAHGCFLSHRSVLDDALSNGYQQIMVLEDDFSFVGREMDREAEVIALIRATPWDVLRMGHAAVGENRAETPSLERVTRGVWGAHCYGLRRRVYEPLAEFLDGIAARPAGHPDGGSMHFDSALSYFAARRPEFASYMCVPSLATQRSSRSDIDGSKWFDRVAGLARVSAIVRRIRRRLGADRRNAPPDSAARMDICRRSGKS